MVTLIPVIKLIILMVIVPFIMGFFTDGFFSRNESGASSEKFMISRCFVFGLMTELAIFQIVTVPFVIKRAPFHLVKYTFAAVVFIVCAIFILLSVKSAKKRFQNKFAEIKKMNFNIYMWVAVIIMIVFQTQLLALNMHTDTDDSRFIAEALEACEKDTMLQLNCITGEYMETFDGELRKEVAAPYPFFIGAISSLTDIHPAVLAHKCFPVFLIPLFYMCMYMLGRFFFSDSTNKIALYMLLLSVIVLFSFESRFSWGYTLLTIIWQGRSIACLIMLPTFFYILTNIYVSDKLNAGMCFSLILASFACSDLSGMAAMMGVCISGIACFLMLVSNIFIKNNGDTLAMGFKKAIASLICSFPVYLYFMLLFLLKM